MLKPAKIHTGRVQMIAHRGLSGVEAENTCAAFVAAGNRPCWGIETDVHQTADGGFVIFHDDTTGRMCAENLPVEQTDLATLRALPLQEVRNENALRGDLRMPIPEEYFAICRRYQKVAVFELKNPFAPAGIEKLVALAQSHAGLENVVFISFCFENLVQVKRLAPRATCQFLLSTAPTEEKLDELARLGMGLDVRHTAVTAQLVEQCHSRGITLNCWTVDDPRRAAELIALGVDQITSNCLF